MQLNDWQESLIITQEECAEVSQAISKILRYGITGSYNNKTNVQRLEEEIGDVMCMINILFEKNIINSEAIESRILEKREKLKKWSSILNTQVVV